MPADQWACDLRWNITGIRRHAGALASSGVSLSGAQKASVLAIEEHAQRADGLLGRLEGADSPAPVERQRAAPAAGLGGPVSPTILIADDDDDTLLVLGDLLSDRYRLTFARDGGEAMAALRLRPFDLAIIDVGLPIIDGLALVKAIRTSDHIQSSAVMCLSGQSDPRVKAHALNLGATDYVTKPFDADELTARIARILAAAAHETILRADAMTDPLTGLANYRSFSQSLERELERSRRHELPLSLITVDLDHLKVINDEHGHGAGNDAVRTAARVLEGAVRKFEIVARQGGDEFAIILPRTDADEARHLAERLRAEIGAQIVHGVRLSASMGIASWNRSSLDAAGLVKASDEALYRAKRAGRDRVEVAISRGAAGRHQ